VNGHRLVVHDRGHDLTGVVHEGEAWAAAARRTVASLHVDPVPVDLSGEVKHFVVDHDNRVTVRAMTRGDLPDVTRWRQSEHVRRWWASEGEPTPERIEARYGPCIDGMSPTRMWVAEVNGRSVGFVQDYRVGDYPEYAVLGPDPDAVGVDYALAEEWSGRGLGARVLWAWMSRARQRFPQVRTYFRGARPSQMRRRCGCSPRRASPRDCGSTSPRRTARSTPSSAAPSTWRACSADERR